MGSPILFLSRQDIAHSPHLVMDEAIHSVKEAFLLFNQNKVQEMTKYRLKVSEGSKITTSAAVIRSRQGQEWSGCKLLAARETNRDLGLPRSQGTLTLFDQDTLTPMCIMDASMVNEVRTGAMSALAAHYLCSPSIKKVGLIGAGAQMRTQLLGLRSVLKEMKEVKVFSRRTSKFEFAEEMSEKTQLPIQPVDSLEEAIRDVELIVIAASDHCDPLLAKEPDKQSGIAVFSLGHRDIHESALKNMGRIVTDSWEHLKPRAGHVITKAVTGGLIEEGQVEDLHEIIFNPLQGGSSKEKNIFFCPVGLAFLDICLAWKIYQTASKSGWGKTLTL